MNDGNQAPAPIEIEAKAVKSLERTFKIWQVATGKSIARAGPVELIEAGQ
ncbi:hypothetical protein [Sinorhizobium psoraleae]|uniref:Uncharacterized protein n=1 Tax=Sinorhizobium psoraleae TaxID=520838 RepID=A0ABT4KHZ4_9HYPH|nr:hypothetical protein [Sinorhizobium psoraleae]MCZ4091598.1 hypothetical protein [Sinorhizobium psoraleae]